MTREVMLFLTGKSVEETKRAGGTQSWALNPVRARQCEYAVLCQNGHNPAAWADGRAPHGHAFMVGHIVDVVPAEEAEDAEGRWLVRFDKYAIVDMPDVWAGWRNPVRYEKESPFSFDGLAFAPMPEIERPEARSERSVAIAPEKLTIEEAKKGLAATFGVKPEAVEIIIRG
jgi:hypothetical protein